MFARGISDRVADPACRCGYVRGVTSDDSRRPDIGDGLDLDGIALREQRACRMPSMVIAAARAGVECGVAAVGLADVEGGVATGAGTAYRVGSITKTFTAALVMGLVERGVIELDAPVSRYVAGTSFEDVPVRLLLAHCGGLQREVPVDMWESMQGPDQAGLRAAFKHVELVDRPSARWHYSNLGYAVLGQIVEEATGADCAAQIDAQLLGPLGMSSTSWMTPSGAAVGYRVDPYADLVHREPDMDQAAVGVAGQLWSTAGDLLRWGDALAGGVPEVVSPGVVEAMHTVQVMVDRSGWTSGWGLGLILDRRGSRVTSGHTGAMPGFLAGLSLDRETRAVAVVLTNATRGAAVGRVATDIVTELAESAPRRPPAPWTPAAAIPVELDGLLGRWWSEADETVFSWRAGVLHACLASAPTSAGETWFERVGVDAYRAQVGRMAGERLFVRRDRDGRVVGVEWATYPFTRSPR